MGHNIRGSRSCVIGPEHQGHKWEASHILYQFHVHQGVAGVYKADCPRQVRGWWWTLPQDGPRHSDKGKCVHTAIGSEQRVGQETWKCWPWNKQGRSCPHHSERVEGRKVARKGKGRRVVVKENSEYIHLPNNGVGTPLHHYTLPELRDSTAAGY